MKFIFDHKNNSIGICLATRNGNPISSETNKNWILSGVDESSQSDVDEFLQLCVDESSQSGVDVSLQPGVDVSLQPGVDKSLQFDVDESLQPDVDVLMKLLEIHAAQGAKAMPQKIIRSALPPPVDNCIFPKDPKDPKDPK
jgi:hypothetical protein